MRILLSKCSYAFTAGVITHDKFKDTLRKIDYAGDAVEFNGNIASNHKNLLTQNGFSVQVSSIFLMDAMV